MKTNFFHRRPYVSEPYNKDYYLKLFLNNGYEIQEKYISNIYSKLTTKIVEEGKIKERYEKFLKKGYKIVSPDKKTWDKTISEV